MPPPPSLRQDMVGGLGSGVQGWEFEVSGAGDWVQTWVQRLGVEFRGLWGFQGSGFRV